MRSKRTAFAIYNDSTGNTVKLDAIYTSRGQLSLQIIRQNADPSCLSR